MRPAKGGFLAMLGKPELADDEGEDASSESLAAKGLISAIAAKDAQGVVDAFRELMACCGEEKATEAE